MPETEKPSGVDLSDFTSEAEDTAAQTPASPATNGQSKEAEREAIFDVPVKITAVVGDVKMPVRDLVRLGRGAVVSLNKKLGSAIDIYANDRLIARGEITIIEDENIAVTMTEIMASSANP
ncbi:flagellar motor switch protein FliN [Saccharibacter floricola]|uniref:Flagellar motor switch protein FliN n=1 Tax=Saccharibacter floricola DSM 15669 TaxID=1123227 RepID=A0ABQ0P0Y8_9PROT|nr:flagellar motor switch protein FliN [Saccharibacter floricola]GBQ05870.1 flagellar motor switch protein [Saccharibacter floricola DSM 15669]